MLRATLLKAVLVVALAGTRGDTDHSAGFLSHCTIPTAYNSLRTVKDQERINRVCLGNTTNFSMVDLDTLHANVWRYAPKVYFHPEEKYYPITPESFLANARIFNTTTAEDLGPATERRILELWKEFGNATKQLAFSLRDNSGVVHGNSFVNGRSTATIYYDVVTPEKMPYNNTYRINYWMYFPFNGCSQQQLAIREKHGGQAHDYLLDYSLCELGIHEGDWEHVTVDVCGDLSRVASVKYSYHEFDTAFLCSEPTNNHAYENASEAVIHWANRTVPDTEQIPADLVGQCRFAPGTTHPIAVASLTSHAFYPAAAQSYIYGQIPQISDYMPNLRALNLVDRCAYDPNRVWQATASNVKHLLADEVLEEKALEILNGTEEPAQQFVLPTWHLSYTDWGFGPHMSLDDLVIERPTCFEGLEYTECPDTYWTDLVYVISNAAQSAVPRLTSISDAIVDTVESFILGRGVSPPRLKVAYNNFSKLNTPFEDLDVVFCPDPNTYETGLPPTLKLLEDDSIHVVITTFAVVCTFVTILALLNHFVAHSHQDMAMLIHKRDRAKRTNIAWWDIPIMESAALLMVLIGAVVLLVGMNFLVELVQNIFPAVLPFLHTLRYTLIVIVIVSVAFNLTALGTSVAIHRGLLYLWLREPGTHSARFIRASWARNLTNLCVLLSFIATIGAALLFAVSMIVIGLRAMLLEGCTILQDDDLSIVLGACVRLDQFGADEEFCGAELVRLCNDWTSARIWIVVIGGGMFLLGAVLVAMSATADEESLSWLQLLEQTMAKSLLGHRANMSTPKPVRRTFAPPQPISRSQSFVSTTSSSSTAALLDLPRPNSALGLSPDPWVVRPPRRVAGFAQPNRPVGRAAGSETSGGSATNRANNHRLQQQEEQQSPSPHQQQPQQQQQQQGGSHATPDVRQVALEALADPALTLPRADKRSLFELAAAQLARLRWRGGGRQRMEVTDHYGVELEMPYTRTPRQQAWSQLSDLDVNSDGEAEDLSSFVALCDMHFEEPDEAEVPGSPAAALPAETAWSMPSAYSTPASSLTPSRCSSSSLSRQHSVSSADGDTADLSASPTATTGSDHNHHQQNQHHRHRQQQQQQHHNHHTRSHDLPSPTIPESQVHLHLPQ